MTFTAHGLDDLIVDLSKASINAKRASTGVVSRIARKIENTAQSLAPKGPVPHGDVDLAPSIHTSRIGPSAYEVGPSARHGIFMETGTYKDPPQPFMFPAAERHEQEFAEEINRLGEF